MRCLLVKLCSLVVANAQSSIIDGLTQAAASAAQASFEGPQVQSSSNLPQAHAPIQKQTVGTKPTPSRAVRTPATVNQSAVSQVAANQSIADDAARPKAVKSGRADSSEVAAQHEVDLATSRYLNATIAEKTEAADAHAAKVRFEQETILAAIAANKSAASQAAADAAKAQFEAAKFTENKKSAAAVAARARFANATLFREKEFAAAKAAKARYEQEKASLAAIAAIKAAASQSALVMGKARLKRKERIEEEKSAAADAARAAYANATLFKQREAGAAKASKARYEEEASLEAMAANKSAASQAVLVVEKAQLMRQQRIEEEKSAAADEVKAKAIASEQAALRHTAAAQLAAEVARARYANATRIEQKEAAKARAAKAMYERAAAESASARNDAAAASSAQIIVKAQKDLRHAQQMQNHAVQMEAHAADIQAEAQRELADAHWSQLCNLLPWLLVALMSPCVICQGFQRVFNGTSNDKSLLEAKLLKGSPCNYLQLGSQPQGPQIPSCDEQLTLQSDLGKEANLSTEYTETRSSTDPAVTPSGKRYVPPPDLPPVAKVAASSSTVLSRVQHLEKGMTPPRFAIPLHSEGPPNNPYCRSASPLSWSPAVLVPSESYVSHRGITPEFLASSDPRSSISSSLVPEYFIGDSRNSSRETTRNSSRETTMDL